VQLGGESLADYDRLIAIEDRITDDLPRADGEVTGHDMGFNEMNIFVRTNVPERAFEHIRRILIDENLSEAARVAYRKTNEDKYVALWPLGLDDFGVA
jgi:hypothetical protein